LKRIESAALLVRSVPFGEADLVVTFFTQTDGKLSAMVRGARRSSKRFGGALEPIHELSLVLEDRGKELCVLKEARLVRAREGITRDLAAMDAAGRALRWIRHLCPQRTPEPAVWASLRLLLDLLDGRPSERAVATHLTMFGLGLLAEVGYALELEQCVRCGRPCPPARAAFVDAAGGGLVCMACGGARRTLSGELRALALRAQRREEGLELTLAQAGELLEIAEEAMSAHADFDPHRTP